MTAPEPTDPESVWLKFLNDSEEAIRRSAPREPSAQERMSLRSSAAARQADSVGDVWQPNDDWPEPAWQDLSTRERVRRGLRALGTVAAIVALLGIFSWLPQDAPGLSEEQDTPTAGQSERAFEPPTDEGTLPPSCPFILVVVATPQLKGCDDVRDPEGSEATGAPDPGP